MSKRVIFHANVKMEIIGFRYDVLFRQSVSVMNFWRSISLLCIFVPQSRNIHQLPDLIVRLVFLDNGKPADNQQIILYEGNPSQASTIRSQQITGQDGIAKFRVSEPLPEKVWVDDNNGRIRGCAWEDQIPLQEILANGITIGKDGRFAGACKGSPETITRSRAKPGEIVIFVRKASSWDNLRHY
jgi:hypothetical protein